jgi:hypothetical protein
MILLSWGIAAENINFSQKNIRDVVIPTQPGRINFGNLRGNEFGCYPREVLRCA